MTYLRSNIKLQQNKLWYAEIITSWMYFFESVEHSTHPTLGEARDWLLEKRAYNLKIEKPEVFKEKVEPEAIAKELLPILDERQIVPVITNTISKEELQVKAFERACREEEPLPSQSMSKSFMYMSKRDKKS